jgi:hypothetical protein
LIDDLLDISDPMYMPPNVRREPSYDKKKNCTNGRKIGGEEKDSVKEIG